MTPRFRPSLKTSSSHSSQYRSNQTSRCGGTSICGTKQLKITHLLSVELRTSLTILAINTDLMSPLTAFLQAGVRTEQSATFSLPKLGASVFTLHIAGSEGVELENNRRSRHPSNDNPSNTRFSVLTSNQAQSVKPNASEYGLHRSKQLDGNEIGDGLPAQIRPRV